MYIMSIFFGPTVMVSLITANVYLSYLITATVYLFPVLSSSLTHSKLSLTTGVQMSSYHTHSCLLQIPLQSGLQTDPLPCVSSCVVSGLSFRLKEKPETAYYKTHGNRLIRRPTPKSFSTGVIVCSINKGT